MLSSLISPRKNSIRPRAAGDERLAHLLEHLWCDFFADVPRVNEIVTGYDYPWKARLGRIRMSLDGRMSEITLNGLLVSPEVPEAVRIAILVHEIVHYGQGFGSPLPRQQRFPHAHGVVSHALAGRDLAAYEATLDAWVHASWASLYTRRLVYHTPRRALAA